MDEIFGNRAPVQVQVAGDLSQRQFLVPVKAVNFVDLFVAPHGWGLILLSGKTGAEARALRFARFRGHGLSPSTINPWVVAKLLFARSRTRRFWSLVCSWTRFCSALYPDAFG